MRGKRRSPEERVSSVAGPLPPCRVCGEDAAGFHYGVNTCEACKGFFRRSLLRNGEYECIGSGSCVIGSNRRKSCPKCRYLKCLSVGMSKDAIKTGRYTYMKRTQDTLELKMLEKVKLRLTSDCVTENDSSSHVPAESTMYSFEERSSSEAVSNGDIYISSLSSDIGLSLNICSASRPASPSVSATSPSLAELMPNISGELMSRSSDISQKTALKQKRIEGLKSTDYLTEKCQNPFGASQPMSTTYDPKLYFSENCFELLSPLSAEESSDFSPASQTIIQCHSPSCSKTCSPATASSASSHSQNSLSTSPLPYQQEPSLSGLSTELIYSETELDDLISVIVAGHKSHVEDANSIPDEVLQEMFRECKERCSLQIEVFGHLGVIQRDEHDQIYTSTGLDVDGRLDYLSHAAQRMDVYVRQAISFMKTIPGFRSLSLSDQTALVKASMSDLFILGYFRGYNRDEGIVVEASRSYCRHQTVMFNNENEMDTVFIIAQRLQNLHLTFEMVVVLKALCVFFSDRATLEEPDVVNQLQFKLVQSLLLLLQRHFPDKQGLIFAKILSVLAQTRNHEEECHKFIKTNMTSGSYIERFHNVPIVFEFFNAHLNS